MKNAPSLDQGTFASYQVRRITVRGRAGDSVPRGKSAVRTITVERDSIDGEMHDPRLRRVRRCMQAHTSLDLNLQGVRLERHYSPVSRRDLLGFLTLRTPGSDLPWHCLAPVRRRVSSSACPNDLSAHTSLSASWRPFCAREVQVGRRRRVTSLCWLREWQGRPGAMHA